MVRSRRRNVQSALAPTPVDAHERLRDYLTEAEFLVLLQGTRGSRYRWRNTAMLLLTWKRNKKVADAVVMICSPTRGALEGAMHHEL